MGETLHLKDYRSYDFLREDLQITFKFALLLKTQGYPDPEIKRIIGVSDRHWRRIKADMGVRFSEKSTSLDTKADMGVRAPEPNPPKRLKNPTSGHGCPLDNVLCVSSSLSSLSLDEIKVSKNNELERATEAIMKYSYEEIIEDLNEKTGKKFKSTSEATRKLIRARMGEGYTVEDFKKLHTNQCSAWKGHPRFHQYLRPETLYRPSHFESYLNNEPTQNIKTGMAETDSDRKGKKLERSPLMNPRIRELKEKFE